MKGETLEEKESILEKSLGKKGLSIILDNAFREACFEAGHLRINSHREQFRRLCARIRWFYVSEYYDELAERGSVDVKTIPDYILYRNVKQRYGVQN